MTMKPLHLLGVATAVGFGAFGALTVRDAITAANARRSLAKAREARIEADCTPHRQKGGMTLRGVLEAAQAVPELPEVDGSVMLAVNARLDVGLADSAQYAILAELKRICPEHHLADLDLGHLKERADAQLAQHQAQTQQTINSLQRQSEWAQSVLDSF